jgi:hypothetical protein
MNSIKFNTNPDEQKFVLRSKEMDLEAGWLGKFFGSGKNAPLNIAGFVVVVLVIVGCVNLFVQSNLPSGDYWKIIGPLITLVLGFLFGKGSGNG